MFDNHIVAFIVIWNAKIVEEEISGFAHHHCREELAAEPGTTTFRERSADDFPMNCRKTCHTWRDRGFNDGNFQVGTSFAKHVGRAKPARAGANNDNVALGIRVKVLKVAACHSTRDLTLTDGIECEALPLVGKVLQDLVLAIECDFFEGFLGG